MAVHAALSLGLDFSPGMKLASEIQRTFNRSVHPTEDTGHFIMVVSFARHTFRLDEETVGFALEAAIGGYCSHLKVCFLHHGVFSFNVSCKEVGFFILTRGVLFVISSSVSSTFGVMAAQIGRKNFVFGNQNAKRNGF